MNSFNTSNVTRRKAIAQLAVGAAVVSAPASGHADTWPSRPIKLVVPSAAGGTPDLICRVLAAELGPAIGQPIVIDNKAGAGGSIGMQEVYRAQGDGYTLGYGNVVTLAINRHLYAKLPYEPEELTGVALIGTVQNALLVRNTLPVKTVAELVAYAKQQPGKLYMGSAGNGTTGHLGGELFKSLTGTFMTHIPYRGSPNALHDLMAGNIDVMFDNLSSCGPHIRSQRVRALAVSGARRSPYFPSLPTVQEAGVKGYETTAWGGIVGPKNLPQEITTRLNAEINRILAVPAIREKYKDLAFETMASTPNLIMTMAKLESAQWADVIKRSGARVD